MSEIARFGSFTADIDGCRLQRDDEDVPLQPRAFDLLAHLLRHPDELLSRDDLLDVLWPDVFVGGEALNQMVRRIRRALEDDARNPSYVATVPRRGYRFVAAVRWLRDSASAQPAAATAPAAPASPPPPVDLEDAFFGRDAELKTLHERAADGARLITLLGPGGTGKTRTAQRFAAASEGWPGGRWFLDLSEATDLEGMVRAVSGALNVPAPGESDAAVARLGHAFAACGRALFVLDNCEHVTELAEPTIGVWMRAAPEALFLVTSRIRLRLRGEVLVPISGLDAEAASALFLERAHAAGGRLTDADARDVGALVAELDWSPLAIELAAARARVMPVAQLRAHLGARFKLLRSTDRDALPRHRSLRVVIEDSVERLAPWERSAMAQLAVLPGRFSLETAEALLELPDEAPWVLDLLQDLCDQSVLQAQLTSRGGFRMLESVRHYLRPPGTATSSRAREAALARVQALLAADPEDSELDMLVAMAMAEPEPCPDGPWLARLALTVGRWMRERGPVISSRRLIEQALACDLPVALRCEVLLERAAAQEGAGERWIAEALTLARASGLEGLEKRATLTRLIDQGIRPTPANRDELQALLDWAEANGRHDIVVRTLVLLAGNAHHRGQLDDAFAFIRRSLALLEESDSLYAGALDLLGGLLASTGDYAESTERYREAYAFYGTLGWRQRQAAVLCNLSTPLTYSGQMAESLAALEEARDTFRRLGVRESEAFTEINLSLNNLLAGRLDAAAAAIAAGRRLLAEANQPAALATLALNDAFLRWLQGDLDGSLEGCAEGLVITERDGLVLIGALLQAGRAGVMAERGDAEGAAAQLAAATAAAGVAPPDQIAIVLEAASCMVQAARARSRGETPDANLGGSLRASEEPFVRGLLLPLLERGLTP